MCYAFQRGECDRGSSCRFSHGGTFYAYGHGGNSRRMKSSEICYAFQTGACDRGDLCRFTHEYGDIPEGYNEVKVCYAFAQGACEYGAACKFSHETDGNGHVASGQTDQDAPITTDVDASDPTLIHE